MKERSLEDMVNNPSHEINLGFTEIKLQFPYTLKQTDANEITMQVPVSFQEVLSVGAAAAADSMLGERDGERLRADAVHYFTSQLILRAAIVK